MNTKLNHIQNWTELAQQARWSASSLAKKCDVSVRTLHRHFHKHMGKNTKTWLAERRQHHALKLLSEGSSIKETASHLGYKQPNNFTRHYKNRTGICPSQQLSESDSKPTYKELHKATPFASKPQSIFQ